MTIREVREHLGRVKPYYLRNDIQRALASAITALQGLSGVAVPSDLRGTIREAIQFVSRHEKVRQHAPQLMYQPGQEKNILSQLINVYKAIRAADAFEDHDSALERKVKLDQAYNQGLKHLAQGRAMEADACFTEAINAYKDEHRLFLLIGKSLMEAEEVRRALPYLKKGTEIAPNDAEMLKLYTECQRRRQALSRP